MDKNSKEQLKRFIESGIVIPKEYLKQDRFKAKLDSLERIIEAVRFYFGYDENAIPLENFLQTEWKLNADNSVEMLSFPEKVTQHDCRRFLNPSTLQIPLITYLLLTFQKQQKILTLIHSFNREIRMNMTPYDFQKTQTGVTRCVTNTRFASLSLRDAGLIKFTHKEAFKRWELSFLGIIVAVMLYEYDWRGELESGEHGGPSRWLNKDLRYAIDFVTKANNFEQIMQKICKNSGVRMDVADYISGFLMKNIRKYNELVLFSDLNKKERTKSINQFINDLEDLPIVKRFMETVSFKYDMADFNKRMKYFFERHDEA